MKDKKNGNKKLEEIEIKNFFHLKIPSFMNESKKNLINQRNFEVEKFTLISQVYEINQNNINYNNNNYDSNKDYYIDKEFDKFDKILFFKESDNKFLSLKSTNESDLYNPIFNNNNNFKIYNELFSDKDSLSEDI